MKRKPFPKAGLILALAWLLGAGGAQAQENKSSRYLEALHELACNVPEYDRDTYRPMHTPLFVDSLNIHAHEPDKWMRFGQVWTPSGAMYPQAILKEPPRQDKSAKSETSAQEAQPTRLTKFLQEAVWANETEKVEMLISKGADINAKDQGGYTPLQAAVMCGYKKMTELLLDNGADVNARDKSGWTPLHYAWDGDIAKLLIARGADVNARSNDGETPLDVAAMWNLTDVAELLLAKGAKVFTLHAAAYVGDLSRVKAFLKEGVDVNKRNSQEGTPLHAAAAGGHKNIVELLLAEGADVNATNKRGTTPLHVASKAEVAKFLLEQGVDVHARDNWGRTIFDYAIMYGHRDVVEFLLAKFTEFGVNRKDKYGLTPLHQAARYGRKEMVEFLLERGADVDAKTDDGQTPLHYAASFGWADVAQLLLARGADINGKDDDSRTPLHNAAEGGHDELAKILVANGADIDISDEFGQTPLHYAAYTDHRNVAEHLLSKGAHIDPRDNAGRTPLHYVAGAGRLYGDGESDTLTAQVLVNKGADVNAADRWGWTPLHFAARRQDKPMVEFLILKGADAQATNTRGHTPLSLVRKMRSLMRGHPLENERAKLLSEIADFLHCYTGIYYVATDGKDSNPGTLERPFRTLSAAINLVGPGDIISVRGGVYYPSSTIYIDKSGEAGKPIRLIAYPGENPVFDFSEAKGHGFVIRGSYWHIKGLTITAADARGIVLETKGAHHNILEQVTAYDNRLIGIALLNGPAHNLVLNSDSYKNFDPETAGENADGFVAGRSVGVGNVFIGCRAWNNADDGFDFWHAGSGVRVEHCYAWRNGENIWKLPRFRGNANGFKLSNGPHILIRSIAWDHPVRGVKLQDEATGVTLYNCTAFRNRTNYQFFWQKSNIEKNVLRNCLSFKGGIQIKPQVDDKYNSWNASLGVKITEDEFLSLDDSVITGPRNPDGSLPENDFLRLAPGSDAIDAGTDVGLSFAGKSPDLGAFEYRSAATTKHSPNTLHQATRDHDIEQVRALLSKGADIDEKDWLGYTALHWAIYFGYPDVVEVLISEGANPNIQSDTGRTPLEIAAEMGYERIVELLRKHGAEE